MFAWSFLVFSWGIAQSPIGAWESITTVDGQKIRRVMIFTEERVITATYDAVSSGFISVRLEEWKVLGSSELVLLLEFDSDYPEAYGGEYIAPLALQDSVMTLDEESWTRLDASATNNIAGIWTIIGRRDETGEMQHRSVDHPRRRYKLLSDNRFHWLAYNIETRNFSGTGGGSYFLDGDDYIEYIEFLSYDPGYVGDSVRFKMSLEGDTWIHQGLLGDESTVEEVIDEIWVRLD